MAEVKYDASWRGHWPTAEKAAAILTRKRPIEPVGDLDPREYERREAEFVDRK